MSPATRGRWSPVVERWWPRPMCRSPACWRARREKELSSSCDSLDIALQPLGDRELALRFFRAAGLLQQLGEEVMGRLVVRIVFDRTAQHLLRGGRLAGFRVRLAEQDVRSAEVRIHPDRLLQRGDRRLPFEAPRVHVAET